MKVQPVRARSRDASFLLMMIVAVTLITVLVFSFARSIELQRVDGEASSARRLSREAALIGLRHAQEELVRDFVTQPFATMDAPGRSSFLTMIRPYEHDNTCVDVGDPRIHDQLDCADENHIVAPMWEERIFGFSYMNDVFYWQNDWSYSGGRGRWYEAEFRNRADRTGLATAPTVALGFPWDDGIDMDGPYDPVHGTGGGDLEPGTTAGDISSPISFDQHWNMLPIASAADARAARVNARYRLRYAVQARDLDGTLLMNPDPDIDWRAYTDPNPQDYAAVAQSVVASHMHAVPPVMQALGNYRFWISCNNTPAVMQHVYLGRGSGFNFATAVPGSANPMPLSFPLMYRDGISSNARVNMFIDSGGGAASNSTYGSSLFADTVIGASAGGMVQAKLSTPAGSPTPYVAGHMLEGPQFSYFNLNRCVYPENSDAGDAGQNPLHVLQATSPFGRVQVGGGTPTRYGGYVATPWRVNLLTAPPAVIRALVYGYLPPGVCGGVQGFADLFNVTTSPAFSQYAPPQRSMPLVVPDYNQYNDVPSCPGYRPPTARYPGPQMFNGFNAAGTLVSDNLGAGIAVSHRAVVLDPYALTPVACSQMFNNYQSNIAQISYPSCTPWPGFPGPYGAEDTTDANSSQFGPNPNSFWDDILVAFSNAVAVARRGNAKYADTQFDGWQPLATPMYTHVWNPLADGTNDANPTIKALAAPTNMAAFDQLFLACLGIDMTQLAPGANDQMPYVWRGNFGQCNDVNTVHGKVSLAVKGSPVNTIRMLKNAGTITGPQAEAMELVLNDFRLSFFGSDPAYALQFRPLDFTGDGFATCSAYRVGRAGADTGANHQVADGLAQNSVADANGNGQWDAAELALPATQVQAIVPFCITGSFFIGRSRYWDVMVRGEVYDNHLKRPLNGATLESTMVIDPTDQETAGNVNQQYATHVIFQRWYNNRIHSLMARQ